MKKILFNCTNFLICIFLCSNLQANMCIDLFNSKKITQKVIESSDSDQYADFNFHIQFYPFDYSKQAFYTHGLSLIGRHIIKNSEYVLQSVFYKFTEITPREIVLNIENWSTPSNEVDFLKYGSKLIKKILNDSKEGIGGVKIKKIEIKLQDKFLLKQFENKINGDSKKDFWEGLQNSSIVILLKKLGFELVIDESYRKNYEKDKTVTLYFEKK